MRQVSVSMPQAMWERLHVRAGQKGVSLSWLIRALILAGVPEDKGGPLT